MLILAYAYGNYCDVSMGYRYNKPLNHNTKI